MEGMGALKALVVGMGVLIVAGTAGLGFVLYQRLGAAAEGRVVEGAVSLPDGATVEGMAGAGDRLGVLVRLPDGGRRIVLIDPARGVKAGEIRLEPARP